MPNWREVGLSWVELYLVGSTWLNFFSFSDIVVSLWHNQEENAGIYFTLRGGPFDIGGGVGGWMILKKEILQVYLYQKNSCIKLTTVEKKSIMHIQWVEKSMSHGEKCIVHTHVARKVIPSAWKGKQISCLCQITHHPAPSKVNWSTPKWL